MLRRIICANALLFVFTAGWLSAAAAEEGPEWVAVTTVQVRPEMDTQFQDLLKHHWLPAVKKSDIPMMETWRSAQFGDAFEYVFASPIQNFAQYDGESPLMKVLKPEEYAMLYERLRKCVSSVHTVAMTASPEASFDKRQGAMPKMAVVSHTRVKMGQSKAYEKLVKEEFIANVQKLDYPALLSFRTVFGGPSNEWVHVFLVNSFAHLDKGPPMLQAVGPEKSAEINAKFAALTEADEMALYTFLPEFSHMPQ